MLTVPTLAPVCAVFDAKSALEGFGFAEGIELGGGLRQGSKGTLN